MENKVSIIIEFLTKGLAKANKQTNNLLTDLSSVHTKTFKKIAKNMGFYKKNQRWMKKDLLTGKIRRTSEAKMNDAVAKQAYRNFRNSTAAMRQNQASLKAVAKAQNLQKVATYDATQVRKMSNKELHSAIAAGVKFQKKTAQLAATQKLKTAAEYQSIKTKKAALQQDKVLQTNAIEQQSQQYGFFKTLRMTHEQWKNNIEAGVQYKKMSGKVANKLRLLTHGMRGFRMEMLSVMFGAMNLARSLEQLLKPAMKITGIQQIWNRALEDVFLPVIDAITPLIQAFSDALSNMSHGAKMVVGWIVLLGFVFFKAMFTVAQMTLFMGGLNMVMAKQTTELMKNAGATKVNTISKINQQFWTKVVTIATWLYNVALKAVTKLQIKQVAITIWSTIKTWASAAATTASAVANWFLGRTSKTASKGQVMLGTSSIFAAGGLSAMAAAAWAAIAPFLIAATPVLLIVAALAELGIIIYLLIKRWKSITRWFKAMSSRIKDSIHVGEWWSKTWDTIKKTAIMAWGGIKKGWKNFWQGFFDIWNIVKIWIWDKILKPLLSLFGTGFIIVFGKIKGVLEKFALTWKLIWAYIKLIAFKAWNGIISGIEWFINGIIKSINWLLKGIKKFANVMGIAWKGAQIGELDLSNLKINTTPLEDEITGIKSSIANSTQRNNEEIQKQVTDWNGWLDDVSASLKGIDEPLDLSKGAVNDLSTTTKSATEKMTGAFSTMNDGLSSEKDTFVDTIGEMTKATNNMITSMKDLEKTQKSLSYSKEQTAIQGVVNKVLGPGYVVGTPQNMVNDFIMRKGAPPVPFSPKDTIVGTKNGTPGSNIVFSPNVTVNATVSSEIDVDRLKDQLSREWVDELRERIRSGS